MFQKCFQVDSTFEVIYIYIYTSLVLKEICCKKKPLSGSPSSYLKLVIPELEALRLSSLASKVFTVHRAASSRRLVSPVPFASDGATTAITERWPG